MSCQPLTVSDGTTVVTLPGDLEWVDEFTWCAMAQADARSVTGAHLVQVAQKQYGRPITLAAPSGEHSPVPHADLLQLQTWAGAGTALTLLLRGVSRPVWLDASQPIQARQAVPGAPIDTWGGGHFFNVTLRFLTRS